jgi:hypothetical protein
MKILDLLPIPTTETLIFIREESVRLKEAQIIVWVSLSAMTAKEWNPATSRFPAILDTGHTHNFALQHQHLIRWAGIRPEMLRLLGHIRHCGKRMPIHAAKVWLHGNEPGKMTVSSKEPHFLHLPSGIAVYPDGANYPRLPLLGLRALLSNNLHLAIDGEQNTVNLRTPDWRTRLLRWLA